MARVPKPWYWQERKGWYATIRGERKNLGPGKKEAYQEFHRLMGEPPDETPHRKEGVLVVAIIDQFLDSLQKSGAAEDTYTWYQTRLQLFARRNPALDVADLKPFHVQQWIDSIRRSPGTKRNYARSIMRCMKWAEEQGLIEHSPIAHFKKPKGGVRQTIIAPEEYQEILTRIRNEAFRDLCMFAWETGARAAECLAIEKRHVDLASHRIVFPVDEEKMQRAPRIIYLTDTAEQMVRRLILRHPNGPIFRNCDGRPYTTDAVNCAFVALQRRAGLKPMKEEGFTLTEDEIKKKIATLKPDRQYKSRRIRKSAAELREEAIRKLRYAAARLRAKKLCLTVFRHSFCHRLLKSSVDALTVSVLMGHADPTMIAKVYSHLSHAPEYLRDALRKSG